MHLAATYTSLAGFLAQADVDVNLDEIVDDSLTGSDWAQAGIILVVTIIVAVAANRFARSIIERALGSGFAAMITARLVGYVVFIVGLIYALNTLGVRIGPLLGALGLGGLVLALALQGMVENFVGGIILQSRRPFTIGDTIQVGDFTGVVTDVDSRVVALRGLDGSTIRIPNSEVLNDAIVTLTREQWRRSELAVGVAYDSNLEAATEALSEAAHRVQRVRHDPPPLVMLREFGDSSINFNIYYWHQSDVPSELAATHDLVVAVHQALAVAGITIAFPQMVVWPGHEANDDPYDGRAGDVFTPHPVVRPPPNHDEDEAPKPKRRWKFWGSD